MAAPLAKTDEIVLLGDDRTTSEVSRLVTNLPPAVQALTGVDLSKVRLIVIKNLIQMLLLRRSGFHFVSENGRCEAEGL